MEDGIFILNQTIKINANLKQHKMHQARGRSTTIELDYLAQEKKYDILPDNGLYRQTVGALLHVVTTTRPDVAGAVGIVCGRDNKPLGSHSSAVKNIRRFLKQTLNLNLKISADREFNHIGYADADYVGDLTERRSTCGYLFLLEGKPAPWSRRNQIPVGNLASEVPGRLWSEHY